jgi:hypothetical protein
MVAACGPAWFAAKVQAGPGAIQPAMAAKRCAKIPLAWVIMSRTSSAQVGMSWISAWLWAVVQIALKLSWMVFGDETAHVLLKG